MNQPREPWVEDLYTETGTMHQDCPFCGKPIVRVWHGRYTLSHYACGTMANAKGQINQSDGCPRRIASAAKRITADTYPS